jgi:hypothetical protein
LKNVSDNIAMKFKKNLMEGIPEKENVKKIKAVKRNLDVKTESPGSKFSFVPFIAFFMRFLAILSDADNFFSFLFFSGDNFFDNLDFFNKYSYTKVRSSGYDDL